MKTLIIQQTKHRLCHNIIKDVFLITGNFMVPFNDENKLQVTKRTTKTEKTAKSLKKFQNVQYYNL